MTRTSTLEITGGARVVTPDSVNLITPYVLHEQEDWFEDEIGFLRRVLLPGHQAIDVGANYGVYTLSMAKVIGPTGTVWAFEPASSTAAFLEQGIAANNFTQVVLERSALSRDCGTAQLTVNDNSELNALVRDQQSGNASETVRLVTLDDCLQRYGWKRIDFLKIDAEGEEANIIEGGRRFFADLSPLILYEVKAGEEHASRVGARSSLPWVSIHTDWSRDLICWSRSTPRRSQMPSCSICFAARKIGRNCWPTGACFSILPQSRRIRLGNRFNDFLEEHRYSIPMGRRAGAAALRSPIAHPFGG